LTDLEEQRVFAMNFTSLDDLTYDFLKWEKFRNRLFDDGRFDDERHSEATVDLLNCTD